MSLLSIQCLPFDVLMEIAKYLNLRDSFSFSKCCTAAFDAVCYIYSHNTVLDFGSTLTPEGVIALSDGDILKLLHAHTRVCHITNFALLPSFSKFAELEVYMKTCVRPLTVRTLGDRCAEYSSQEIGVLAVAVPNKLHYTTTTLTGSLTTMAFSVSAVDTSLDHRNRCGQLLT